MYFLLCLLLLRLKSSTTSIGYFSAPQVRLSSRLSSITTGAVSTGRGIAAEQIKQLKMQILLPFMAHLVHSRCN